MKTIKITKEIISYIENKNKYIKHFEIIPILDSEWFIKGVVAYPNVCCGNHVIELTNTNGEWLRLPLTPELFDIKKIFAD